MLSTIKTEMEVEEEDDNGQQQQQQQQQLQLLQSRLQLVQKGEKRSGMEEEEQGKEGQEEEDEELDPLSLTPPPQDSLGPVQDKPEDLSVKRSSSPNGGHKSFKTEPEDPQQPQQQQQQQQQQSLSRSSSSPGSQGSSNGEPSRAKRSKPIPPPLDLNARTLSPSDTFPRPLPRSPGDLPRECLPIRKRHMVNVKDESELTARLGILFPHHPSPSPSSPTTPLPHHSLSHHHHHHHLPSTLALTPSSATTPHHLTHHAPHPAFTHFPVPPPLIPVPPGLSAAAATSPYHPHHHPKSPFLSSAAGMNGFPTPPTDLHSPAYPWHSPTLTAMGLLPAFSPLPHSPLPFPTSSLLSPSPSYHSSSNSSREDLPTTSHSLTTAASSCSSSSTTTTGLAEKKMPPLTVPTPRYGPIPNLVTSLGESRVSSSSPAPSSPLLSPRTWSHSWPTPVWQCFVAGVNVRFLLQTTDTPWQKSEELGWKDRLAMKVDSRNPYQYAPNGLTVVKIDVITRDGEANAAGEVKTLLRLRMSPHNVPELSRVEMLAECPLDHPFFVKDKGWCSAHPRHAVDKYGIPCQDLTPGDVCLPPNHPEAVRTPDLCDRFKRFEFSSQDFVDQLSPSPGGGPRLGGGGGGGGPLRHSITSLLPPSVRAAAAVNNSMMSPPMSPAKKKNTGSAAGGAGGPEPDKPKRPMNGFMLFAKKYRLELIQQHPGKDNRAISVLLGEAWKSLPLEDREKYSQKAKVLADEQKKLFPDCWKRKRSLSSAAAHNSSSSSGGGGGPSPHHLPPQSPSAATGGVGHHHGRSMPGTPTSLAAHHHHHHHQLARHFFPHTVVAAAGGSSSPFTGSGSASAGLMAAGLNPS